MADQEADQAQATHDGPWRGYACPECHTLFRVSAEAAGLRVECPSCAELVMIPDGDEGESASGIRFQTIAERIERRENRRAGKGVKRRVRRKVKKKRKKKRKEDDKKFDWERDDVAAAPLRAPRSRLVQAAVVASIISLVGVVVLILTGGGETSGGGADTGPLPELEVPNYIPSAEVVSPEIANVEMRSTMTAIEASVRKFLESSDLEDVLKMVRAGAGLEARIREYYQTVDFAPTPHRDIAPEGGIMKSGDLWSVDVVLQDFTIRPIALEQIGDRYLVDWESWVGYSEMPWKEFVETRPREPKLFRVLCSEVEYFNFQFEDDRKWTSFRLESPDHSYLMYGYVPRFSIQESMLSPHDRKQARAAAFVVKLRFPDEARTGNQVLIDEVMASGWVMGGAAPPAGGLESD